MKEGIHPEYMECAITCSCGTVYHTRSTRKQIHVEICANCHPFFTGQQRLVDTAGRVERFRRKYTKKTEGQKSEDRNQKTEVRKNLLSDI